MSALPKLIIVGAGGFGRETWAWAEQSVQIAREWRLCGFIDDDPDALRVRHSPGGLLGRIADWQPKSDEVFIVAIGTPATRRRCMELLKTRGAQFARLFHRTVVLGHEVKISPGCILCPYAVVTANNLLGEGVVVNLHSTVDHDSNVGSWSQINCHCDLTASVEIGEEVFLGSRVTVAPKIRVGNRAYIGAGSVVLRDVAPETRVFGAPARRVS